MAPMPNLSVSTIEAALPVAVGIVATLVGYSGSWARDAKTPKKVLRWVGPALVAVGLFLMMMSLSPRPESAYPIAARVKAKLELPMRVDEDTLLYDVRALSKSEIGYFLTVTTKTAAELEAVSFAAGIDASIRDGACQNANYETLFKAGIALRLTYRARDKTNVAVIAIKPADCGY
jgi:hypothetical protein